LKYDTTVQSFSLKFLNLHLPSSIQKFKIYQAILSFYIEINFFCQHYKFSLVRSHEFEIFYEIPKMVDKSEFLN